MKGSSGNRSEKRKGAGRKGGRNGLRQNHTSNLEEGEGKNENPNGIICMSRVLYMVWLRTSQIVLWCQS